MKEILIRMTEQQYDALPEMPLVTLHSIIRNGQILPKGHGDLIDRSKLEMSDIAPEPWYRPMMAYTEWEIDDADVVVEADKEGAEE